MINTIWKLGSCSGMTITAVQIIWDASIPIFLSPFNGHTGITTRIPNGVYRYNAPSTETATDPNDLHPCLTSATATTT